MRAAAFGTGLRAAALAVIVFAAVPALAVQPNEVLDDRALEARARTLSAEVRCLVCQNQSIDDSNAELARDLRLLVRERLVAGDSDAQVLDYLSDRYGPFVLLEPPTTRSTLVLWYGPAALLAVGAVAAGFALRRRRQSVPPAPLTIAERMRLESLMEDDEPGREP